jgi:hypothetical protein
MSRSRKKRKRDRRHQQQTPPQQPPGTTEASDPNTRPRENGSSATRVDWGLGSVRSSAAASSFTAGRLIDESNAAVRKDLGVVSRAVREEWDIPQAARRICPQILLEIATATVPEPLAAGKRGPDDYKFSTTHRLRAIELVADMRKANFVMEQQAGKDGEKDDGRLSLIEIVQQVEAGRRTTVVDDAYIDAVFQKLGPPPAAPESIADGVNPEATFVFGN